MELSTLYKAGFSKSYRALSTVAILWALSLVGTIILVSPVQRQFIAILGDSMITEMMYVESGFDLTTDLIIPLSNAFVSFSTSFFIVGILVFLAGIFVTAGIFRVLYSRRRPFRKGLFIKGADRGFVGYLVIALISGFVTGFLFALIVLVPLIIAFIMGAGEAGLIVTAVAGLTAFAIVLPFILLVADFARVNLVADKWESPVGSIKNGIRLLTGRLLPLWLTMFVIIVVTATFSFLITRIVFNSEADSRLSILMLMILSQVLLFIKVWLKVIRYGIMTAIYEEVHGD